MKKNIVWISMDHYALSGHKNVNRPLMDYLKDEGIVFENAYTVCPLCSPARASTLTGQYPHVHKMTHNFGKNGSNLEFDDNQKLISHYLLEEGYRCSYFGKWHCGDNKIAKDYGFEGFSLPGYGYPYGCVEYKNYLLEMNLGKPITKMEYCLDNSELTGQNVDISALDNWFDYCAGYAVIDGSKHLHESYFLSHLASNWLKEYAKSSKDENFFIRIEPWGPHPPYVVTSEYADNVDRKSIKKNPNFDSKLEHRPEFHRDYMEFWKKRMNIPWDKWQKQLGRCHEQIELVEDAMLEVIHTLKDLNLLDDCVIFVSADHGDALASNGGVANKGSLAVQETIRIPMGIRLGEQENAGLTFTKPVTNMDIFPTILDITGVGYGDDIQGRSLKEAIQCRGDGFEEVAYLHHYGMVNKDVQRILVSEKYKYIIQSDGFEELYDIKNDNSELYNIVNENEPEVIKMRKLMLEKMSRYNDDYKEAVEIKCILKEKLS